MKDLKLLLSESNIASNIFPEVQNEIDDEYAYSTISISKSINKYKKCILVFCKDSEAVSFIGYNSVKDFIEDIFPGFDIKDEWYEDFEELKEGETMEMSEPGYYVMRLY